MGGDNAPLSNINGAIDFLKESNDKSIELFFVCDEKIIPPLKELHFLDLNKDLSMNKLSYNNH